MRRSFRSRRSGSRDEEDLSDVAAWLYTDLLLGLAVVFIGGGAFVGQILTGASDTKNSVPPQELTYQLSCEPVEFELSQNSSGSVLEARVNAEIEEASQKRGWTEAKPGVVQIFGLDKDLSIANNDGKRFQRAAVSQSATLGKAKVLTAGDTDQRKNPSNVVVRIFVVYKGQVKDNGCKN